MTTAEVVRDEALRLAAADVSTEEAVGTLMERCAGRRVPVVLARQRLSEELDAGAGQAATGRAIGLLEEVLGRLPRA
jgi:hypothetical protein